MTAPAPYYDAGGITLYCGDSREISAWLEADVLVTDPPYGIGDRLGTRSREFPEWDDLDVRDEVLEAWGDRPRAVFGAVRRMDRAPAFRGTPLVWEKGEVGMGDVGYPWRPNYELVYVNGEGWAGPRSSSVLHYPLSPQAARLIGHPTPKPISLMQAIIAKAPPGVIADPFAGSGSTLIAAQLSGRRAIGVEQDPGYCEIIVRRLAQQGFVFDDLAA